MSDHASEAQTGEPPPKGRSPLRPLVILIGIVAVAIALYAFGAGQGRSQLDAQRAEFEERLATAEHALSKAEGQLAIVMNVKNLQEAEVALLRGAVEIDRRNFGTANEHVRKSGVILDRIRDPAGGVSLEEIQLLREDVAQLDINVAVNLEDQRMHVLGLAGRLRDLIPEVSEEPVDLPTDQAPSAAESSAAE